MLSTAKSLELPACSCKAVLQQIDEVDVVLDFIADTNRKGRVVQLNRNAVMSPEFLLVEAAVALVVVMAVVVAAGRQAEVQVQTAWSFIGHGNSYGEYEWGLKQG